jgi:hypothetical protein
VARGARHGGGELIVRKGMKDMWAPGGPFQPTGPKEDWAESNEKERKRKIRSGCQGHWAEFKKGNTGLQNLIFEFRFKV